MRVIVQAGTLTTAEIEWLEQTLGATVFVVAALETSARHDLVIRRREDFVTLTTRAPVSFGALRVTPVSARFELVTAGGDMVTRARLIERCWRVAPLPRTVDVAVSRLRKKLEPATNVQIVGKPELGYHLTQDDTRRVLVVEDDESLYNSYRLSLTSVALVDFAATVAECVSLLARQRYDAHFVDLSLGEDSGVDAIAAIRERSPRAPIMIVSGRADRDALDLSAGLGVPYAIKPVSSEVLLRFVECARVDRIRVT